LLHYGKHLDVGFNDKLARSNRGRARGCDSHHRNLGYRRGPEQLVELRGFKKRTRLQARLEVLDSLHDMELGASDGDVWLFGVDLTAARDLFKKQVCGRDPFEEQQYESMLYDWLDGPSEEHWFDDGYDSHDDGYDDSYSDHDRWESDDPMPTDAAWRDLWVAGHVTDEDFCEYDRYQYNRDEYEYNDAYDHNYLDDLVNPLIDREEPATSATVDLVHERNLERYKAGERYFKQHKRTTLKPLRAA
jgi:hypothetical protein